MGRRLTDNTLREIAFHVEKVQTVAGGVRVRWRNRLDEVDRIVAALKGDEDVANIINELRAKVATLSDENERLTRDLQKEQSAVTIAASEIATLTEQCDAFKKSNSNLRAEVTSLQALLKEKADVTGTQENAGRAGEGAGPLSADAVEGGGVEGGGKSGAQSAQGSTAQGRGTSQRSGAQPRR
jgi:hypothetical protein